MFTHSCIKCSEKYESEIEDPYYCPTCHEGVKAIAEEIDRKNASRPKKEITSDYKILMDKGQTKGQSTFVRASDLGITF